MKHCLFAMLSIAISLFSSCRIAAPDFEKIPAPLELAERALYYARKYIEFNAGYEWGGQDPLPREILVDCSGLVIRCYEYAAEDFGYFLLFKDTTASGLQQYVQKISLSELSPGDLIFMGTSGVVSHVALFVKLESDYLVFIDSTSKPEEGIDGVSERKYSITDERFISFGRMFVGRVK